MSPDADLLGPKPVPERTPAQRLIAGWSKLFLARFGTKPIVSPKDGAAVKRLLAREGVDEALVARRIGQYFDLDDEYLRREGYPLGLLPGAWNKLAVAEAQERPKSRVPDADATEQYLARMRGRR